MDKDLASAPSSPTLSPSSGPKQRHPLLLRPLYIFHLPPTLLASLHLRSIDVETFTRTSTDLTPADFASSSSSAPAVPATSAISSTTLTCKLCPSHPTFPTSGHQRAHFSSEWHRYNLQVAFKTGGVQGQGIAVGLVDEKGWEDLVNDLGDASDQDNEGDSDGFTDEESADKPARVSDLVSLVVKKLNLTGDASATSQSSPPSQGLTSEGDDVDGGIMDSPHHRRGAVTAKSALLWFHTSADSQDSSAEVHLEQTQLGIYRSTFPDISSVSALSKASDNSSSWYTGALRSSQAAPLRRAPIRGGKMQGWKGKRLKGMDDAAGMLGVNFLEGAGFVPGLVTMRPERGSGKQEDSDEDSDGQVVSSSSSSSSEQTSVASTSSSLPKHIDPPLRTWTVLLLGGGHFSIVVVALNPHIAPRKASRNRPLPIPGSDEEVVSEDRSLIVLAHKAFHRYTTRRKQGGSQSAQDASGKFAKSAGAQLRRAGEVALAEEVRALLNLSGWRKLIGDTERVYARAGGRAARGVLWTWGSDIPSPLEGPKSDGRLRTIPFSTGNKATVSECLRVFAELSKAKIARRTEEELEEEDEAYRRSMSGSQAAREELQKRRERERVEREEGLKRLREKAKKRKGEEGLLSKEEKKRRERFERMVEMVRRGRVEALVNHLEKYGPELLPVGGWDSAERSKERSIDASLPEWWRVKQLPTGSLKKVTSFPVPSTLLHLAAEAGQEEVVQWLLVEQRADPTIGILPPPIAPLPPPPASPSSVPSKKLTTSTTSDGDVSKAHQTDSDSSIAWPHRTAYDLIPSSSKNTRNIFRRLKANQPDWFDWEGAARVTDTALTGEMEENQTRRKAGLREKVRAREREREEKEKETQRRSLSSSSTTLSSVLDSTLAAEKHASSSTKNRLGGGSATQTSSRAAANDAKDRMEGVSAEMRARIEREKRARAAEERMKRFAAMG